MPPSAFFHPSFDLSHYRHLRSRLHSSTVYPLAFHLFSPFAPFLFPFRPKLLFVYAFAFAFTFVVLHFYFLFAFTRRGGFPRKTNTAQRPFAPSIFPYSRLLLVPW